MVVPAEIEREIGVMAITEDAPSPIGKRTLLGGGLLVLALILWELRDAVPSWLAKSVTATIEFSTTAERDDTRVTRAFEAVRQTVAADAILESLPNQTQVRHTRLTVLAPAEDAAVALATRMSEAMQRAFAREGGGELLANVRRRATPVADHTTEAVGQALRIGAAVFATLGVVLVALGVMRLQAGADRLPTPVWWGIGFGVAIPVAGTLLPGAVVMALFFMAIPGFIAGLILWKVSELRHAATWPSTRAKITRSEMRAEHHRHSGEVTQVRNLPHVEYEFTLGDRVIKGTRIGVGEIPDDPQATLDHYRVGTTVAVYYDPKNPENALLERDPPLPIVWLYAIAAGVFLVGLAVLALFWNISEIFDGLAGYFPEKAFLPGVAFFTLGGVLVLALLWASRREAAQASAWPQIAGRIVSSSVEHYRQRVGGARTGVLTTFYEAVVEYAYSVNGRDYHGTRLSFGGKLAGAQALAEAQAARYPEDSQVMVHYDPMNPSNAVLDIKIAHGGAFTVVALAFFGLAIFFSGAFR
jgi:hypothetical protein